MASALEALNSALTPFLDAEYSPFVEKAAQAVAARHSNTQSVLFYGSCLRTGRIEGQMLDFYVIVDDYKGAYKHLGRALWNRLIPPNVFYFEQEIDGVAVRAKYAVLSAPHFRLLASEKTFNPAIWARFSQPIALAFARDDRSRQIVKDVLVLALLTLIKRCAPLLSWPLTQRDMWAAFFEATYNTEFRAERGGRPGQLYDLVPDFYSAITGHLVQASALNIVQDARDGRLRTIGPLSGAAMAGFWWFLRRVQGKLLHVFRLIKGAATFDGGVDYLAWKVYRHSGVHMEIKPWHRKFPVVAGVLWLRRLKGKGAIK